MTPMEARTSDDICSLRRDHLDFDAWRFWLDVDEVWINDLKLPRTEFDRLTRWYMTGRQR